MLARIWARLLTWEQVREPPKTSTVLILTRVTGCSARLFTSFVRALLQTQRGARWVRVIGLAVAAASVAADLEYLSARMRRMLCSNDLGGNDRSDHDLTGIVESWRRKDRDSSRLVETLTLVAGRSTGATAASAILATRSATYVKIDIFALRVMSGLHAFKV